MERAVCKNQILTSDPQEVMAIIANVVVLNVVVNSRVSIKEAVLVGGTINLDTILGGIVFYFMYLVL